MKLEEAITYLLVKRNGGMTTDQLAEALGGGDSVEEIFDGFPGVLETEEFC